jgi:hypothetical protein
VTLHPAKARFPILLSLEISWNTIVLKSRETQVSPDIANRESNPHRWPQSCVTPKRNSLKGINPRWWPLFLWGSEQKDSENDTRTSPLNPENRWNHWWLWGWALKFDNTPGGVGESRSVNFPKSGRKDSRMELITGCKSDTHQLPTAAKCRVIYHNERCCKSDFLKRIIRGEGPLVDSLKPLLKTQLSQMGRQLK